MVRIAFDENCELGSFEYFDNFDENPDQVSAVYFTLGRCGDPIKNKDSQFITLSKHAALTVPYIRPTFEKEKWVMKRPDDLGWIPITLEPHELLCPTALQNICDQLNDGYKLYGSPFAVKVRTEKELWLADFLSLPLAVWPLSKQELLYVFIPLTLTRTFKRLIKSQYVAQLFYCIIWHWQRYAAQMSTAELESVPLAFVEMYFELNIEFPQYFRFPVLFDPCYHQIQDKNRLAMSDPFEAIDKVLVSMCEKSDDTEQKHRLFQMLLKMNYFSNSHCDIFEKSVTSLISHAPDTFLSAGTMLSAANVCHSHTCMLPRLRSVNATISTEQGAIAFLMDENGSLRSLHKLNVFQNISGVALYFPTFIRFILKSETNALNYALSDLELEAQIHYPDFNFLVTIFAIV